mmetsp:Transcript_3797/g.12007  ORF Transcript_3797/g.12007 Transcript_3797/m.12007 type:complete len:321 (+) Transcript_3797:1494-2456(+)
MYCGISRRAWVSSAAKPASANTFFSASFVLSSSSSVELQLGGVLPSASAWTPPASASDMLLVVPSPSSCCECIRCSHMGIAGDPLACSNAQCPGCAMCSQAASAACNDSSVTDPAGWPIMCSTLDEAEPFSAVELVEELVPLVGWWKLKYRITQKKLINGFIKFWKRAMKAGRKVTRIRTRYVSNKLSNRKSATRFSFDSPSKKAIDSAYSRTRACRKRRSPSRRSLAAVREVTGAANTRVAMAITMLYPKQMSSTIQPPFANRSATVDRMPMSMDKMRPWDPLVGLLKRMRLSVSTKPFTSPQIRWSMLSMSAWRRFTA